MMANMFYVLYSPSKNKYIGKDFWLGSFQDAAHYDSRGDAQYDIDGEEAPGDLRVVGPCAKGETP